MITIQSEHLERAETALARTYQLVQGQPAYERILMRAKTDPDAWQAFASHHKSQLFKKYLPDIDPRHEPAIMTMFLHMFAVGAVSQRLAQGDDE